MSQGARMSDIIADQIFVSNRGTIGKSSRSYKSSKRDKTFQQSVGPEDSIHSPSTDNRSNLEDESPAPKPAKKGFWKKLF